MCLPFPYLVFILFLLFSIQRHIWGIITVPRDSLLPPFLIALPVMDRSRKVDLVCDLGLYNTQNSTLSDLPHFWSVDSSGREESNDAKNRLICPSSSKLRAVKDLGSDHAQNSTLSDLALFWSVYSPRPDESNDAKSRLLCPSC